LDLVIFIQFLLFNLAFFQTGGLIEISGQVTDQVKNLPLTDVSVQIKGSLVPLVYC
jgi:hypothetical protein